MSFGVGVQTETRSMDCAFFPYTRNDVLKLTPLGIMVVDIVRCNHANSKLSTQLMNSKQSFSIIAVIQPAGSYRKMIAKDITIFFDRVYK